MVEIERLSIFWGYQLQEFLRTEKNIRAILEIRRRGAKTLTLGLSLTRASDISSLLRMEEEIALALKAPSVRLGRYFDQFHVEIPLPKQFHRAISYQAFKAMAHQNKGLKVGLGVSTLGKPVSLTLNDPATPHALVVGTTGCGKSNLVQSIITQAMQQNGPAELGFVLVDIKRKPLMGFASAPHLRHPVITDERDALAALRALQREITNRLSPVSRTVVVIGELAYLINGTGGLKGDGAALLSQVAALGREHGIVVIAETQHASQEVIGGPMMAANFPVRVVGAVSTANQALVATTRPGSGANKLFTGGDFLLVTANEDLARFQAPLMQQGDLALTGIQDPVMQLQLQQDSADGELVTTEKADPIPPHLVADLIARRLAKMASGTTTLAGAWRVGSSKAERIRQFTDELTKSLDERSVELCLTKS